MAASRALGTPSEWASQAAVNALLRYAPQREALKDLQRAAAERFQESVRAGRSEGRLGAQAAEQAVAPTKQIFSTAAAQGARGQSLAAPILAALSASSPFRAAAANESAAGDERLGQSEAHALSDLQQKKVAATELPAFTRSAAMSALLKELSKLQSKGSALEGLEGADRQSEVDKQRSEAGKLGVTERGQNLTRESAKEGHETSERNTAAHNKTAERDAALAHGGKGANGYLSPKEQAKAVATFSTILGYAKQLGQNGRSRGAILHALEQPIPSESREEPDGSKVSTTGHAGYPGNAVTAAALDVAEIGALTKNTEARLRREGYVPAKFGKPYKEAPHPGQAGR